MIGEKEQRCLNTVIRSLNCEGSLKKYFGLLQEDIDEINNILKTINPNEKLADSYPIHFVIYVEYRLTFLDFVLLKSAYIHAASKHMLNLFQFRLLHP